MNQRKANPQLFFWLLTLLALLAPIICPARLSPLAEKPDWKQLDAFQKTITRDEFASLLRSYARNGVASAWILIDGDHALIRKGTGEMDFYRLQFAPDVASAARPPGYWRPLPSGNLLGARIALDPGHLGGKWARMEERWFQIGDSKPVMEGEMTLLVARKIALRLRDLGAVVSFVRDKTEPVTKLRPASLLKAAELSLIDKKTPDIHPTYSGPDDPAKAGSIQWEAERLFYRQAEIRARAERNNRLLKPDLTLCLHFDAEAWGDPRNPTLVPKNHLHFIVNGNYSAPEIALDDVRLELLRKLLSRSLPSELALSEKMAPVMSQATGLPPYEYPTPNARRTGKTGFVWLRNLMANRVYQNPVLYIEPYVMNNQQVFDRIQLGDYEGTRLIDGVERKSIYNEYADTVVEALLTAVTQ